MSVGVCIINRNGIALAADSAGTFTGNRMFYNSMNKVFSLSNKYTYGAITCGNTSLYNVSIDQVLKEFCVYLDERDGIEDFFDIVPLFQEFIEIKKDYYRFNSAESIDCISIISDIMNNYGNKIKQVIETDGNSDSIDGILNEFGAIINSGSRIENYDVSGYIDKQYRVHYEQTTKNIVPDLAKYTDQYNRLWRLITDFFNLSLLKETQNPISLLFAGYGSNDAFPKYVIMDVYTVVGGKLKCSIQERFEESNNSAKIIPLAQGDVVLTFCKGISDTFMSFIPKKVEEVINEKIAGLSCSFSAEQNEVLTRSFSTCKDDISKAIIDLAQNDNVNPLFRSVQFIPLPEMAFLAENLVNITSLKRTYSLDGNQLTVGGPTDVAVLSKGDGFVWIKNKQVDKS